LINIPARHSFSLPDPASSVYLNLSEETFKDYTFETDPIFVGLRILEDQRRGYDLGNIGWYEIKAIASS
jgi:hypothetical protein